MGKIFYPFSFPGEGRGLVAEVVVTEHCASLRTFRNWAPAFAGEGRKVRKNNRRAFPATACGFTLIEMMVALAVFSLAALALIRLESATIRGASILDSTLTAQMVARNVAIEALTDARAPTLGTTTGAERNGGRDWAWSRLTTPTGDARILKIQVTVLDAAGRSAGHLTVVRSTVSNPAVTVSST